MSKPIFGVLLAAISIAVGAAVGLLVPCAAKYVLADTVHTHITEIKQVAIQHLLKDSQELLTGSDVDFVFETIDRQPGGRVMVVGFCRFVSPKPSSINGGRFWLALTPKTDSQGYDVRNIYCHFGITEGGSPWKK